MSGICGIVHFDGEPVDPAQLEKMAQAMAYRGPDGIRYWVQGNVGMAHLALHTTPEAVRERQPLVSPRTGVVLVADARVDYRDELIPLLASKGYIEPKDENGNEPTDADLILAAYDCWGEESPKYIDGDFAFAVWDKMKGRLFAGRDKRGYRHIHYYSEPNRFVFSTDAYPMFSLSGIEKRINECLVAQDLLRPGWGGIHESYFEEILKLGPAERLWTANDKIRTERYWDFNPDFRINYKDERDYIEHFRGLFYAAVKERLRLVRPAALFLSGGLRFIICSSGGVRSDGKGECITHPRIPYHHLCFPKMASRNRA